MPVQIDQEQCLRCERCLRACNAKAIYFENGIRLVDYSKCRACLNCVQVCPRNAIVVNAVEKPEQVLSIKIDHEKCTLCEECLDQDGKFCPRTLFYKDIVKKGEKEVEGIRFKYGEIVKCQGCLKCELLCPEKAIKAVKLEV